MIIITKLRNQDMITNNVKETTSNTKPIITKDIIGNVYYYFF